VGLLNLTLNRSGAPKNIALSSHLTLFNGGTLHLRDGYFSAGSYTLSIGQSPAALCNIIRHTGALESLPVFVGKVNLTYTATTNDIFYKVGTGYEMPLSPTALHHLTVNTASIVVTLRSSPTVNGTLTLGGNAATKLALNGQTLTLNGDYNRTATGGNFIGSSTSSLIVQGNNKSITGTLHFDQSVSATANNRALQNLTINLAGSPADLVLDSHAEITNLNLVNGSLTAAGPDVSVTNAWVRNGARFVNNSANFPLTLPSSATGRAFNNASSAFVNKFDRFGASAHAGNLVSASASDLSLPGQDKETFTPCVPVILAPPLPPPSLRSNWRAPTMVPGLPTRPALALGTTWATIQVNQEARPVCNLTLLLPAISLQLPTAPTIPLPPAMPVKRSPWVINRSGSAVSYTTPAGTTQNALASNSGDLWLRLLPFLGNATFDTSSFGEVKFVMNGGSGSIRLVNLRNKPDCNIVTNAFVNTCITPGSIITVPYSINEGSVYERQHRRRLAQSINDGSQVRVQLSNELGVFDPNYYNNTTLNPVNVNSANTLLLNSSVQVQLPVWATAPGYRYRVVVSELPSDTRPNAISTSQPLYTAGRQPPCISPARRLPSPS
jgi:hypothetical protein